MPLNFSLFPRQRRRKPTMEMEGKHSAFLFSFIFLLHSFSVLSKPLQFQSFYPNSLPNPQPLSWLEEDSKTLTTPDEDQQSNTNTNTNTLSLQLHHLDSLSFNSTPQTLFNLRLQRDAIRVKALSAAAGTNATAPRPRASRDFSSSVISGLPQNSGEYFTRLGIGTPAKYSNMVVDTGSDVVWIQCTPCRKCYTQEDPVFDPSKSSTFLGVTCESTLCRWLDSPECNSRQKKCLYQVSYLDGSSTVGDFSTETMTFGKTRVKNIAFGCGHDNKGLFVSAAGLLGLGRGKLSFPSQAGGRFGSKFSYCLVDRSASSKSSSIIFGDSAVSGTAVFTPMLVNPQNTFYYVGLTGVSVGGTRVPGITASLFKLDAAGNGGVIVDSGTTVTRLTRPAYIALRDAFRNGTRDLKRAPGFQLFDTCFILSGKSEVKAPTVVMHFNGADVSLPASNYLIPVDSDDQKNSDGTFCFAFAESSGTMSRLSIIGNIQQQGFRVVYDLAGQRIGFAPRGCA